MSEETFEEWFRQMTQGQRFDSPDFRLTAKAWGRASWNHQQKKLDQAEEENKILREAVEFGLRYYRNGDVGDKCKQALEKVRKEGMSECKTCANCRNSFYGYGESSLNYGLRCDEYDKSVDETDTCNRWEESANKKIERLEQKLQAAEEREKILREAVEFGLRYYSNSEVGDKCKQALEKVRKR